MDTEFEMAQDSTTSTDSGYSSSIESDDSTDEATIESIEKLDLEAQDEDHDDEDEDSQKMSKSKRRQLKIKRELEETRAELARIRYEKELSQAELRALTNGASIEDIIEHRKQIETERIKNEEYRIAKKLFDENQKSFIASHNDYDVVTDTLDVDVSQNVERAILESDLGPQILYALGKNSNLRKQFESLNESGRIKFIGKLENKLENNNNIKLTTKPIPKPLKTTGARTAPVGTDFHTEYRKFIEKRGR
jgi:hypothetical protein